MSWKDDARKRSKEIGTGGKFKPSEGENTFRILPNPKGADHPPHAEYAMHYEVGPKKRPVVCGKDVNGRGTCWLCDSQIPKLAESANKAKQAMAEAMGARSVLVVNVSRVDPESGEFSQPQKWVVSARQLIERLLLVIGSRKVDYHDPKKGRNLTVTRTGSGKNDTRYSMLEPDAEASVVPKDVLKAIKPITVDKYSIAAQKAAILGQDAPAGGGLDEDEEDDMPKKKKRGGEDEDDFYGKKKKKKKRDEDEDEDDADADEDEDGEDEDEDEDEDDAPKSKKKKKAVKADEDEDEDEDADEDEDGEDEDGEDEDEDEDADEDEDGEDEDGEDEDGEDEDGEDEDDADEDDADEDEDEAPKKGGKSKVTKKATKKAAAKKAVKKTAAKPGKKKK